MKRLALILALILSTVSLAEEQRQPITIAPDQEAVPVDPTASSEVTITTVGGSLFLPGSHLGTGGQYVRDENGLYAMCGTTPLDRCVVAFNNLPYGLFGCFPSGNVYLNYTDGNGVVVDVESHNLEGCNLYVAPSPAGGSIYQLDAEFSGVDSTGAKFTGTMTATERYYRKCVRSCGMYLTTAAVRITLTY